MTRNDFIDLAGNDHKGALVELFDQLIATQETLMELLAAVSPPEVETTPE